MSNFGAPITLAALAALAIGSGAAAAQERASPPIGGGSRPPPGSYQATCRGISLNGNMLRAQCPGPTGAPISSSLDINGCRGRDIANDGGYLRCGGGGGGPRPPRPPHPIPPTPPGGGFQAIVYKQTNYRGKLLTIHSPVPNFSHHPGFNDKIRSIRIIRGRALVCTDSNYRGRCVTLHRSYPDLNAVGMSNQISSIR